MIFVFVCSDGQKSRRRRGVEYVDNSFIEDAEENWKRQRTILGMAYCLKKFDDPKLHLGQDCDE